MVVDQEQKSHRTAVCVVAHPDDEVLWFASLLHEVQWVVTVFLDSPEEPKLGRKRLRAIAELPYAHHSLGVREAGTYGAAHWQSPAISDFGIELNHEFAGTVIRANYEQNFHVIRQRLERLIPSEATVYTHNPWGEYGHADHVQIYRVLDTLRQSMGLRLMVPAIVSKQSAVLASAYDECLSRTFERRSVNMSATQRIAAIYKHHGCWSWADDWEWEPFDVFLSGPVIERTSRAQRSVLHSKLMKSVPACVADRVSHLSDRV